MEITVGLDEGSDNTPGIMKDHGLNKITMSPQVTNITVGESESDGAPEIDFSMRNFFVGKCKDIENGKEVDSERYCSTIHISDIKIVFAGKYAIFTRRTRDAFKPSLANFFS